jgi:hypothetical protein
MFINGGYFMFLQAKDTGVLVKVLDVKELIDPNNDAIKGQQQEGEDDQDTESYHKNNLIFPSGESLPRCWLDANYQSAEAA